MPHGYKVVPYYDRRSLVQTTLRTVFENLTIGIVLVFLVLIFFLGNVRSASIAAINIPLALCGAFLLMWLGDTPANLISLGAIDFGIIIDSTVIVMENIHHHFAVDPVITERPARLRILSAAQEVGGPMFFSTLIFVIAFLPLFTMRGVEGAIFSPMSHTYAYALGAAILLAVTLSPVLSSFAMVNGIKPRRERVWRLISRFYHGLFVRILMWPRLTLTAIIIAALAVLALFPRLGGEFLPKLEEGNIWLTATMPLTISLDHGATLVNRVRRDLNAFPEVDTVVSQLGRPDDGTETTGFFSCEFSIDLKPASQWPAGVTKENLVRRINARLTRDFPAVSWDFSQNIEANINEALSGVKGSNSVKVFGPDLEVDERIANQVIEVMGGVPGIVDLAVYRSLGQPNLLITPDRAQCARYGLNVGDVAAVVQAAIGGQAVTQVLEGDRRFDLVVRWQKQFRSSLAAIREIRVPLPGGGQIPLGQVATINTAEGASFIYREGLERYVPVRFAVRERDLQSAVEDAKNTVAAHVKLPEGVHLDWAGEYGELRQANRRLMVVVPFALILIAGVLYAATTSLIDTFVIMAQIPVACMGGILGLFLTGTPFSVSAAVGFISIFGIATMDGILLSFYIRQLWTEGHPFVESIIMGSDRRLRATMMTDLVDALGLLPAALSTRIGAQTQRPLAIVVIGGRAAASDGAVLRPGGLDCDRGATRSRGMARDGRRLPSRGGAGDYALRRARREISRRRRDGFLRLAAAHDNDAERAARAGLAILDAIAKLNEQPGHAKLSARVGIDSGPVVVGKGAGNEADVFGDAPNIAARVEAAPNPAPSRSPTRTHRLVSGLFVVEDCGAQALKGIERPIQTLPGSPAERSARTFRRGDRGGRTDSVRRARRRTALADESLGARARR